MQTGSNQSDNHGELDRASDEINCWQHVRALACCLINSIRRILGWFAKSLGNADNLPTFLVALFTLLLVVFANYAWNESRRGTAALESQVKAIYDNQRAWMGLPKIVVGGDLVRSSQPQIEIEINFTNVGKSPAYGILVSQWFVPRPIDWVTFQRNHCNDTAATTSTQFTVAPGDAFVVHPVMSIPSEDFGGDGGPQATGCINYRTAPDEGDFHQTGFTFTLSMKGNRSPEKSLPIPVGSSTVSADELQILFVYTGERVN